MGKKKRNNDQDGTRFVWNDPKDPSKGGVVILRGQKQKKTTEE